MKPYLYYASTWSPSARATCYTLRVASLPDTAIQVGSRPHHQNMPRMESPKWGECWEATLSDSTPESEALSPQSPRKSCRSTAGKSRKSLVHKEDPFSTRPESITVCGVVLEPSIVFDTFWTFAAERKAIDDRRRAGKPAPWTNDPILEHYYFCNTFRVLDKVTQYMIREVIEKGSQDPVEVVFRVTLFNTFVRIETWEKLQEELGPLTWATYNRTKYQKVLAKVVKAGHPLYTGSYQRPAPHFEFKESYMNHLCLLENLMENEFPGKLLSAKYMADVYEYLVSFPSMGDFTTYQLMLSLSYTNVLNFHRDDFVVPGLGASSGLFKMFGNGIKKGKAKVPGFEIEVIRWLTETQEVHFHRMGIDFSGLGPDRLRMDVADVEHTLCEVDKYARIAHPRFKGTRTQLRKTFTASSAHYPKAYIPSAWSHPARKIPRIRVDKNLVVDKRYTIKRIGGHRKGADGREFLVFWQGYPDSDATWEPELILMADATTAVNDYLASRAARSKKLKPSELVVPIGKAVG